MDILITFDHREADKLEQVRKALKALLGPDDDFKEEETAASALGMTGASSSEETTAEYGFDEIIPIWLDGETSEGAQETS